MMSFLGLIGYVMQGYGLQTLFELIYAKGSVNTMLNGKDISRATQSHKLIYVVFECNLGEPSNDGKFTTNSSLQAVKELLRSTYEDTISSTME